MFATVKYVPSWGTKTSMIRCGRCACDDGDAWPNGPPGLNPSCCLHQSCIRQASQTVHVHLEMARTPFLGADQLVGLASTSWSSLDHRRRALSSRHQSARCCPREACSGSTGYARLHRPLRSSGPLLSPRVLRQGLM